MQEVKTIRLGKEGLWHGPWLLALFLNFVTLFEISCIDDIDDLYKTNTVYIMRIR